jgi:hypothetical protein
MGSVGLAIPHSRRRLAWASHATAAPVGGFSLLAVLIYVADEYPAAYANVGAQALQAGVVAPLQCRRDRQWMGARGVR